jgi:tetratricopeptide (TPR) repeat protein
MNEALQKAIEARNSENFEEALAILEALHAQNPNDPLINYHYAWTYDRMGRETSAVPYYVRAIENGLSNDDLRGALLGLGSTYRTIGEFEKAVETLKRGAETFPDAPEFPVFLSMALYNVGQAKEGMSILLKLLVANTENQGILRLRRAIELYAEDLDRLWLE